MVIVLIILIPSLHLMNTESLPITYFKFFGHGRISFLGEPFQWQNISRSRMYQTTFIQIQIYIIILKYSNKIFKTLHTKFWKFFFTTNLNAIQVLYIYKHTEMYLTEDNSFLISSKDIKAVLLMSHICFYFVTLLVVHILLIGSSMGKLSPGFSCKRVGQEVPCNLNHSVILILSSNYITAKL